MLNVQEYLRSGKTFEDLTAELGIKVKPHDTLPIAILDYSQIDSPKTHPIVRECRGLVLRTDNYDLVCKGFSRFFNWGELQDEMDKFDFTNFVVHTKEDGSLCLIYYFDGKWMANTRGSWGLHKMDPHDFTWNEAFCKALGISSLQFLNDRLDKSVCYVCEFVSPFNKVVRRYAEPKMYLLSAFIGGKELEPQTVDNLSGIGSLFVRPVRHHFDNITDIQTYLNVQAENDPTFEGVVICDINGLRYKIKNATYLALHRLKGEGDNLFNPKHLIPFVMAGEDSELLTYFEEVTEFYYKLKAQIEGMYVDLHKVWSENHHIDDQKQFALKVKDSPFSSILFMLKKSHGNQQTEKHLKDMWRKSGDLILKRIK